MFFDRELQNIEENVQKLKILDSTIDHLDLIIKELQEKSAQKESSEKKETKYQK